MKKTSYIRLLIFQLVIWIVFFGTFLFPAPTDIVAAGTSFTFDVSNPVNNAYLNNKLVNFSGTYSLDTANYPNSALSISIADNSVTIPSTGLVINPDTNTWSFSYNFTEGPHTVTFTANDGSNVNSPITTTVTFTIDTKRPIVTSYKLVSTDHVGNTNAWEDTAIEDMTHVPLDARIQITVKDESNQITYKKTEGTYNNPIEVISDSQVNIGSNEDHYSPPNPNESGEYTITFTPSSNLEPSTTYYVYITKNIVDKSGNPVYPKVLKFTTTSQKDQSNDDDPHGDYAAYSYLPDPNTGKNTGLNRSNLCTNCHNSHMGGNVKLLGGKFIKDTSKNPTEADNTTNYCMACHDGTTASRMASKVDNMDLSTGSKHDEQFDSKHLPNEGSCASCHNPHLSWTKDNPNILQDHYTFDHTKVDPSKNAPQEILDSDNILCETCHDRRTYTYKDYQSGTVYKYSHYRKSSNRLGTVNGINDDTDLCFRCHNPNKLTNSDIQTLSEDSNSKHNFTALDASNVTGALPCSECHETHGSSNIKLLKPQLGQENQTSNFVATSGEWDAGKERQFCLKCHNGTTAIYGVTGKDLVSLDPDPTKDGHDISNLKACSDCHNNPEKRYSTFLESSLATSHAPYSGHTANPPAGN